MAIKLIEIFLYRFLLIKSDYLFILSQMVAYKDIFKHIKLLKYN